MDVSAWSDSKRVPIVHSSTLSNTILETKKSIREKLWCGCKKKVKSLPLGWRILQASNNRKSIHSSLLAFLILDVTLVRGHWSTSGFKTQLKSPASILNVADIAEASANNLE